MLQLDSSFSERAYGAGSFTDFIERLRKAGLTAAVDLLLNASEDSEQYPKPDWAAPGNSTFVGRVRGLLEPLRFMRTSTRTTLRSST